jgi:SAM-dependent methyltransferase
MSDPGDDTGRRNRLRGRRDGNGLALTIPPTLRTPWISTCIVCGSSGAHQRFDAKEMMFGTGEPFSYGECSSCGTLQLLNPPADMGRFYPSDGYYSMNDVDQPLPSRSRRTVQQMRTRLALRAPWLPPERWSYGKVPSWARWFHGLGVRIHSSILDVGSGTGALLQQMARQGFRSLHGVDPFIPRTISYASGVIVHRSTLSEIAGQYDLVTFHHSLEHMRDSHQALADARRLLRPGGHVVVRIPIADSWAFRHYGARWTGLDPPRHLFVYTRKAVKTLSDAAGLQVSQVWCDSNEEQFWASEQYCADVPLYGGEELSTNGGQHSLFDGSQIVRYREMATRLNRNDEGDQAVFILTAKPTF